MFGLGWLTKKIVKGTCEVFGMDEDDAEAIGDVAKWGVRIFTLVGVTEVLVEAAGEVLMESGTETLTESGTEALTESSTLSSSGTENSSNVAFGSNDHDGMTDSEYEEKIENEEKIRQESIDKKEAEIDTDIKDICNNTNKYASGRLEIELKYDLQDLKNLKNS